MSDAVLVTGAFGLVGSATVQKLAADGRRVVATDVRSPAHVRAAEQLAKLNIEVRWADLTDVSAVDALVGGLSPSAIVHLAAIIPPFCYSRRDLARRVNVDATAALVRAAAARPAPPRFVAASSIAVYGPRNPHQVDGLLTADTPLRPADIYGAHKVEAEQMVRASGLPWLVLRLGGVVTARPRFDIDPELIAFEGLLPTDGRIQTVDVRDAAAAFAAATTVDATGEVLLIGGDDTHRLTQGDIAPATTAAMGLAGALPAGRPGDPDSADGWFATDWMDTTRARELLAFQRHSWPQLLAETRELVGWRRRPLRLAAPLARRYLQRRSPGYGSIDGYADPWRAIRDRWGDPSPDRSTS